MTEPPDTGVRDPAGRSPSHRSWLLPVAILLAIALILGAAVTMRLVDERGDEADEDEAVTVTETQAPDEGGDLPAGFVALRSQDNPILPSSNEFTELLRLPLDPGTYLVWGKVGLHNRDPSSSFSASCALVPSNEDGSKRPEGELGSD